MSIDNCDFKIQSESISFIRFPLIVGVVFIHTYFTKDNSIIVNDILQQQGLFYYINYLFSKIIGGISVPLFFFISGFLFFLKMENTFETYKSKFKNRFKTLVVPYLLWNSIVLFLFYFFQQIPLLSSYFTGAHSMHNFSFIDFLNCFWNYKEGTPIHYPFWFIRDLIFISLFTPLLRLFIVKFNFFSIFFFVALLFIKPNFNFVLFNSLSLVFFSIGAFFSIYNINLVNQFRKLFKISAFLYPVLVVVELYKINDPICSYIHIVNIIIGCIFFFNIVVLLLKKKRIKVSNFLTSATFFVFAAHEPLHTLVKKIIPKCINPTMEWQLIILYFMLPTITITICLCMYCFFSKFTPRIVNLLTGRG